MNKLQSILQSANWKSHNDDNFRVYQKDANALRIEFKTIQEEGISIDMRIDATVDFNVIGENHDELLNVITRIVTTNKYGEQVNANFVKWQRAFDVVVEQGSNINFSVDANDDGDGKVRRYREMVRTLNRIGTTSRTGLTITMPSENAIHLKGSYQEVITLNGDTKPSFIDIKIKPDYTIPDENMFYRTVLLELVNQVEKYCTSTAFYKVFRKWLDRFKFELTTVTNVTLID